MPALIGRTRERETLDELLDAVQAGREMVSQVPGAAPDNQRAATRHALGALLVPIFFVLMFSLCIIGLGVGTAILRLLAWTDVTVALLSLWLAREAARERKVAALGGATPRPASPRPARVVVAEPGR